MGVPVHCNTLKKQCKRRFLFQAGLINRTAHFPASILKSKWIFLSSPSPYLLIIQDCTSRTFYISDSNTGFYRSSSMYVLGSLHHLLPSSDDPLPPSLCSLHSGLCILCSFPFSSSFQNEVLYCSLLFSISLNCFLSIIRTEC